MTLSTKLSTVPNTYVVNPSYLLVCMPTLYIEQHIRYLVEHEGSASLHKRADSIEPSLLAYIEYGCRLRLRPIFSLLAPLYVS